VIATLGNERSANTNADLFTYTVGGVGLDAAHEPRVKTHRAGGALGNRA
jgi:hypothetical protein